jgi:hypothetical protein
VDRGSAEQFLAAVEELRRQHPHLELRVNGPLPPYSFVDTPASQQAEGAPRKRSEPQQPSRRPGKATTQRGWLPSHPALFGRDSAYWDSQRQPVMRR